MRRALLAACLIVLVLSFPSALGVGAQAGDKGAFVGYGTLHTSYNGRPNGECAAAFTIASEPDGGWRISGVKMAVPLAQYCGQFCCFRISIYPGATDAQGSPESGFAGSGTLLGVTDTVEVGPLGSATSFRLTTTSTSSPGAVWALEGSLDFSPNV